MVTIFGQCYSALSALAILLLTIGDFGLAITNSTANSYDIRLARFAFDHAAAAYSPDPESCVQRYNESVFSHLTLPCDYLGNTCAMFVSWSNDWVVVSFRGTTSGVQLMLEVFAGMSPPGIKFAAGGKVQHYFSNALDTFWDRLLIALEPLIEANHKRILFTGHSLGGAVAALASSRFAYHAKQSGLDVEVTLITFGQPRVGNHGYARAHNRLVPKSFRVVHAADLVVHLPACWASFSTFFCSEGFGIGPYHHGTEVWYQKMNNANSEYEICLNEPSNEDHTCSNQKYPKFSIDDHLFYFDQHVSKYGISGCLEETEV